MMSVCEGVVREPGRGDSERETWEKCGPVSVEGVDVLESSSCSGVETGQAAGSGRCQEWEGRRKGRFGATNVIASCWLSPGMPCAPFCWSNHSQPQLSTKVTERGLVICRLLASTSWFLIP